jgi:hypothetical protein
MNIPGKIYIVKAGTPINVNFDSVKHHVDNYMSLTQINVPTVLRLNGISETELNVRDAVAIVGGHMSKIVHLAQQNYCTLYHYDESFVSKLDRLVKCAKAKLNEFTGVYTGADKNCFYSPLEFAHAKNNIEYPGIREFDLENYNRGGRIIIVPANNLVNVHHSYFKLTSKNELIGFLITHGSGHNAGIVHISDPLHDKHSGWLMGTGPYIKDILIAQKINLQDYLYEDSDYNQKSSYSIEKIHFLRAWIKTRFKS